MKLPERAKLLSDVFESFIGTLCFACSIFLISFQSLTCAL